MSTNNYSQVIPSDFDIGLDIVNVQYSSNKKFRGRLLESELISIVLVYFTNLVICLQNVLLGKPPSLSY